MTCGPWANKKLTEVLLPNPALGGSLLKNFQVNKSLREAKEFSKQPYKLKI